MNAFKISAAMAAASLSLSMSFTTVAYAEEDHAWMITSLERQADAAATSAIAHEKMARVYRAGGGPPKANGPAMVRHCERLVERYRDKEELLRAEAAERRTM